MELLVTLRKIEDLDKIKSVCDGFIVGSLFSCGYKHSFDDIRTINNYCKENKTKLYITIENFINEEERPTLISYMAFIRQLDVDGIYFHDLGVIEAAKTFNLEDKLIYDGQTVVCNSLDVAFYISKGFDGVVLARELTLDELDFIVTNNPQVCDVLVFGHQRMSYSKRKFLTNYFKEINKNYDFINSEKLTLVEEKRNYKLPIIEDKDGTRIYTDYIFEMYKEMPKLKQYIKRGIIDTLFIDINSIPTVVRDYKHITDENASFLFEGLNLHYPNIYSTGYLYQKTNITKDE